MKRKISSRAFSLVEVILALGLASFALLAIIGILPVGVTTQQDSIRETVAINLVTGIIADLREVPDEAMLRIAPTLAKSSRYKVDVTQSINTIYLNESGDLLPLASAAVRADFKVVINLEPPPDSSGITRRATRGNITISWPAMVERAIGSITIPIALDRN